MPIRRQKIRTLVEDLLKKENISEPPVPVSKIAKKCGATIYLQKLDGDMSGFIARKSEHTIIGVNTNHPSVRRRFTIAHELGHLLLHNTDQIHIDRTFIRLRNDVSSQGVDEGEMEANLFAAELLMPKRFLVNDLKNVMNVDFDNSVFLEKLARKYNVSTQALIVRFSYLEYIHS